MLTEEIIKTTPELQTLTPEQITAITALSKNAAESIISANRKEWWDKLDLDVAEVFGEPKPGGVKSHEHHKNWLKEVKNKADKAGNSAELQTKIDALTKEKDELLKSGAGDAALKTQLASIEQRLKDKEAELRLHETEKTNFQNLLNEQKQKNVELELTHSFDKYIVDNGVKFKGTIPESILRETLEYRKAGILKTVKPDLVDDGQGGKAPVLRDSTGEILRNPENGLKPFTAGELFLSKIKDIVETGRTQTGAGSNGSGNGAEPTTLDLSGAKTQLAADDIIVKHILTNEGIAKTDKTFTERQMALRKENNVASLPLR